MTTTYRINEEPKFLYLKTQKLNKQLYQLHLQAHQRTPTWKHIQDVVKNQLHCYISHHSAQTNNINSQDFNNYPF